MNNRYREEELNDLNQNDETLEEVLEENKSEEKLSRKDKKNLKTIE